MGLYFNPPTELPNVARQLEANSFDVSFASLLSQTQPTEVIFGLYDRVIFKNAPWISDARELEEFTRQVKAGALNFEGFYAIDQHTATAYVPGLAS